MDSLFKPPRLSPAGLLVCVQAGAVAGVCRLLHVRAAQDATQPVSAAPQDARRVHLPAQLDRGQAGAAQLHALHELPQQRWVSNALVVYSE